MTATRRGLLGGAATCAATSSTLAATQARPHPDVELVRLGRLLEAAWVVETAAYAAAKGIADDEAPENVHADAMRIHTSTIVRKIEGQ